MPPFDFYGILSNGAVRKFGLIEQDWQSRARDLAYVFNIKTH